MNKNDTLIAVLVTIKQKASPTSLYNVLRNSWQTPGVRKKNVIRRQTLRWFSPTQLLEWTT